MSNLTEDSKMFLKFPNEEQIRYIRQVCNENLETRNDDLQHIKDWLLKEPHLPDTWDDGIILLFLKASMYSLESCKKRLDTYFSVRTAFPDFFSQRNVRSPELQKICEVMTAAPLPTLSADAQRVTVAKATYQDFETPNIADLLKLVFMVGDVRMLLEKEGIAGDIYILDAGFPLAKHFLNVNPLLLKKFLFCVQEAYPVNVTQIHIINTPPFIEFVMNVIRPFLNETLRKRFHIHGAIDTLFEFVPKELLPEEYGGEAGNLRKLGDRWVDVLEQYTSWFEAEENVKSDESKRLKKMSNHEDIFGSDGSFRQLCID